MNNKHRFNNIMNFRETDRTLYFEEGIRKEVLNKWNIKNSDYQKQFKVDYREEIIPDIDVKPAYKKWPSTLKELNELKRRLNPNDSNRLPKNFYKKTKKWKARDYPIILRVHRGFFLSMGVYDNHRFLEVLHMLIENPTFVIEYMNIQGEFAAVLAENILKEINVDAVYFSEPIGSNVSSLISPQMYEEFVLESYKPLLNVCEKYEIQTKIFLTYANASALIPSILKYGINCLWACEVNCKEMDYINLRKSFGKDLRLIGGIDLDTLLKDKESIKKEIISKVPALIEQGGYIPLADGRVRPNISFENYSYYRNLIEDIIQGKSPKTN
jgi:uroporphyrinogen-III decarboxylase